MKILFSYIVRIYECMTTVNVLVNGELTDYFEYRRGVRHGDCLSPYFFIFAADVLNKIISKGIRIGYLVGLG
jgi:hypothetical protein